MLPFLHSNLLLYKNISISLWQYGDDLFVQSNPILTVDFLWNTQNRYHIAAGLSFLGCMCKAVL